MTFLEKFLHSASAFILFGKEILDRVRVIRTITTNTEVLPLPGVTALVNSDF